MPVRFLLRPPTAHPLLSHVYVSRTPYLKLHSCGRLAGVPLHNGPHSSGLGPGNQESCPHGHSKSKGASRLWTSVPFIVLGFMPIVSFGLGTWQMHRLKWKVSLIDDLEDKLERDPMVLPRNIKCDFFLTLFHRAFPCAYEVMSVCLRCRTLSIAAFASRAFGTMHTPSS